MRESRISLTYRPYAAVLVVSLLACAVASCSSGQSSSDDQDVPSVDNAGDGGQSNDTASANNAASNHSDPTNAANNKANTGGNATNASGNGEAKNPSNPQNNGESAAANPSDGPKSNADAQDALAGASPSDDTGAKDPVDGASVNNATSADSALAATGPANGPAVASSNATTAGGPQNGLSNQVGGASDAKLNQGSSTPLAANAAATPGANPGAPSATPASAANGNAQASASAASANHPSAPAASDQAIGLDSAPSAVALSSGDLSAASAVLHWVGYDYREKDRVVKIELVTRGHPKFDLFQEQNRAKQPELVVRFFDTRLRAKLRRAIDASEFRSPVAYVRTRYDRTDRHTDVIVTMRDAVQPHLFAKDGDVLLTYPIPDRYLGVHGASATAPTSRAELLPDAMILPTIDEGSEQPGSRKIAKAYTPDPGASAFKNAPADGGAPVQAAPVAAPGPDNDGLPKDFSNGPSATQPSASSAKASTVPPPPVAAQVLAAPTNSRGNVQNADQGEAAAQPAAHAANNAQNTAPGEMVPQAGSNGGDDLFGSGSGGTANQPGANTAPAPNAAGPTSSLRGNTVNGNNGGDENGNDSNNGNGGNSDGKSQGGNGEDDDNNLNNFDNGNGNSKETDEKFQVRAAKSHELYVSRRFGLATVAQDDLATPPAGTLNASGTTDPTAVGAAATGPSANATTSATNAAAVTGVTGAPGAATPTAGVPQPQAGAGTTNLQAPQNAASPSAASDPAITAPASDSLGSDTAAPQAAAPTGKVVRLDFRDAPLSEVLRALADENGTNFILSPGVGSAKVSMSLFNVPWDEALRAVLESNQLGMVRDGSIVRIDTLENLTKEKTALEEARQSAAKLTGTKMLVMRLNYAKADQIKPTVEGMLASSQKQDSRVHIEADPRTNSLIIEAIPVQLAKAKALIERLDTQTPQVQIASRIVEVQKTASNFLGINWGPNNFRYDQGRGLGFGNVLFPNYMTSKFAIDPQAPNTTVGDVGLHFGSLNNFLDLDLRLRAEEVKGTTNILESNTVLVQDNQPAKIVAGSEDTFKVDVPSTVVTGSGGAGATGGAASTGLSTISYNLTLDVTPHISADGAVQMLLAIDSASPSTPSAAGAVAGRTTKFLNTTLLRKSGETAVIGGLYSTHKEHGVSGIPILSDLPIIGALFRSTTNDDKQRELLIMVTPTIMNGSQAAGAAGSGDQGAASGMALADPAAGVAKGGNNSADNAADSSGNNATSGAEDTSANSSGDTAAASSADSSTADSAAASDASATAPSAANGTSNGGNTPASNQTTASGAANTTSGTNSGGGNDLNSGNLDGGNQSTGNQSSE